ncbi:MAG: WD40 repeat domain-containing protein, partial [archaeon]|nr:WD40 repeat domain-containing protein [archaeon]
PRLLLLLATVSHKGTQFQQVCLSASPQQPTTPSPVRTSSSSSKQGAVMVWASSPNTGSLLLINSKTFKIKHTLRLPIEYSPTALLCVEQTMWVGTIRGVILIYDLATRHVVNSAQIGDTRINKMIRQTVNDPNANVWICSNDASILVYSPTGAPLRSLSGHTGKSRALATAGNYVWSGAFSGRILVFDFSTFRCLECWLEKNEEVSLIEFSSPDRIVIGYRNGVLRIYSINLFGTDFANLPAFSGNFGGTGSFSGFSGFSGFSASQSNLTTLAIPTLASPVRPDSLASPGPSEPPPSLPKEKKSIVSRIFGRK